MSTVRQVGKEVVCVCVYIVNHKRNEILPFAITWMDMEDIMLNEIS